MTDFFAEIRADAEKWRALAAAYGRIDRKAEETLALLAELDRLRLVASEYIRQQQAEVRAEGGGA